MLCWRAPAAKVDAPLGPACASCRITGTLTLGGVSLWLLRESLRVPPPAAPGHKAVLVAMSTLAAAAAAWRASTD